MQSSNELAVNVAGETESDCKAREDEDAENDATSSRVGIECEDAFNCAYT